MRSIDLIEFIKKARLGHITLSSSKDEIKMAKANFKLFALLLSNSNNYDSEKVNSTIISVLDSILK